DLAKFDYKEIAIVEKLFTAWFRQGLPEAFSDDGVKISLNTQSGLVFLLNAKLQAVKLDGDGLVIFFICPYCGNEVFPDKLLDGAKPKTGETIKENRR
ncbi:MAG: hypothetical protein WCH34_18905, partial [Bacteroidota bacterium]